MKNFLLFVICTLGITSVFAQEPAERIDKVLKSKVQPSATVSGNDNNIYNLAGIQVKPEFPGGSEAFFKAFAAEYNGPDPSTKGKVYVTFVVEKDGSLTNIKVIRDIGAGAAAEAIRVLKKLPKWVPGEHDGYKVRTSYALPLTIGMAKQ